LTVLEERRRELVLRARNIDYKPIFHASSVPIIQVHFRRYDARKREMCSQCGEKLAEHSIVFYYDLPYAKEHFLLGESIIEIDDAVWRKVRKEQRSGLYRAHATLYQCDDCTLRLLYEETRQPDIGSLYTQAVALDSGISLIVGRFERNPAVPLVFFTVAESIGEFIADFRENSLRPGIGQCRSNGMSTKVYA